MSTGWKGKWARHEDGREGKIKALEGASHVTLLVRDPETKKDLGRVLLNSFGPDQGDTGWSWWCPNFLNGAAWLSLGDHNGPKKAPVYGSPPKALVDESERLALSNVQASHVPVVKSARRARP